MRTAEPGRSSMWETAKAAAMWSTWSLLLNLVWEAAQSPLYLFTAGSNARSIAYAVIHCTLGNGLIALSSYRVAAVLTRDARCPLHRALQGGAVALVAGLTWTAFSEWRNVYVTAIRRTVSDRAEARPSGAFAEGGENR